MDRERKIAQSSNNGKKIIRSILKGGAQKLKERQDAFAFAAQFDDDDDNNNASFLPSNKSASPEQRLNSMVKQYQEGRTSPPQDNSGGGHVKVTRGSGRVGGLRDSIILAREHLTHDENKTTTNSR